VGGVARRLIFCFRDVPPWRRWFRIQE